MQDKTIDNALLALRKAGGQQGKLAEVSLDMRGVTWSGWSQDAPLRRGQAKNFILSELREGAQTAAQLGDALRLINPDIDPRSAKNRCYQALVKLKSKGHVVQDFGPDGCLWRLG
jgi:hypothetical protein